MEKEINNRSFLHLLDPRIKLTALFLISLILLLVKRLEILAVFLLVILILYKIASFSWKEIWQQTRPFFWIISFLFLFHSIATGWQEGSCISLRFLILLLSARITTLTTPFLQMMETLKFFFIFLKPFGNPEKISLVFSLIPRFVSILSQISCEVKEAGQARGLEKNIIALAVPIMIRSLKMCENITMAIEARYYDCDDDKKSNQTSNI